MKNLISPFHLRLPFTVPLALRYVFITLLLTGFVLGAWSGITPIAHAATHAAGHRRRQRAGHLTLLYVCQPTFDRPHQPLGQRRQR